MASERLGRWSQDVRPCLSGSLNGTTSKFSDDFDDELDPSDIVEIDC